MVAANSRILDHNLDVRQLQGGGCAFNCGFRATRLEWSVAAQGRLDDRLD